LDNVTHSLVGVALADAISGSRATKSRRPLVVGAGIIAANAPDIDIAYSAITQSPIGYLVHHRGHTHTIAGLVVLAAALVFVYRLLPPVRAMRGAERLRLWLVMSVAIASHLAMDWLNSYGVHPFYPIDNNWYYGDAVFIFEPSLWLVLGIAVAWNGRSGKSRVAAALPILVLLIAIASMDLVPWESSMVLAALGGSFAWAARRMPPQVRAVVALTAASLIIGVLIAASRGARAQSREALQPQLRGRLIDIVLTPNPASPLCWGIIAIESIEATEEYVLRRGTLSLAPALKPPGTCASHRFSQTNGTRTIGDGHLVLAPEMPQSLRRLRELSRRDCWARAWLRFGRAPVVTTREIFDLRFAARTTQNFTQMPLVRAADEPECPSFVPNWEMPRKDLFTSTSLVLQRNARTLRGLDGSSRWPAGF
jgi:inner membrane protein